MNPSLGLISMWTGEISANVEHMKTMAIHQMTHEELEVFSKYVRDIGYTVDSLRKHIQEVMEA